MKNINFRAVLANPKLSNTAFLKSLKYRRIFKHLVLEPDWLFSTKFM